MQREGIYFHNKFAPVLNWSTFRLIVMMAEMDGWESIQIDYVLAFSQAQIDSDVYLYLPEGFHVDGVDKNETYFIKLRNIYMELVNHQQISLICLRKQIRKNLT